MQRESPPGWPLQIRAYGRLRTSGRSVDRDCTDNENPLKHFIADTVVTLTVEEVTQHHCAAQGTLPLCCSHLADGKSLKQNVTSENGDVVVVP